MSIFMCGRCHELRDADDGCDELGGNLICLDCYDEFMEEASRYVDDDIPVNIYGEEDANA